MSDTLKEIIVRFTSRKFLAIAFVMYWATTHPEMTLEQAFTLLVSAGVFTLVEGQADLERAKNGK